MERKEFLKRLGMSSLMVPIVASCSSDGDPSAMPIITEFSPSTGTAGTTVTITGINFSASTTGNTVYFNGTAATVTQASSTQLVVTVPTGATTGKISVSVNDSIVTSGSDFTVTASSSSSLSILSFTSSAAIGSSITITGTNFSATASENTVTINGVTAVVTAATATTLTVTVPASATSGVIAVTVGGVTVTSTSSFTVASATSSCSTTNSETEGPFPTKSPSTLVMTDIRSDRTGVAFTMQLTITNKNNSCLPLSGAMVDVWHCDKDGNYSEYGGTNMQSVNYTTVHFLRGRQTTDTNGQVGFTSIFPGWYSGRATHIHVHIYDSTGKSLLVTQIAFPEGTDNAVTLVNASTANGYTKGMSGYTYNSSDNVFSDGVANELASVSGSIADGYGLTHTIVVNG